MKKLFSIMAIAALVFVGTNDSTAATTSIMPANLQFLATSGAVTIIQDEGTTESVESDSKGFHQELQVHRLRGHKPQ